MISKIKEPTGVNASVFAQEFNLLSLKSDVDKEDAPKLKPFSLIPAT